LADFSLELLQGHAVKASPGGEKVPSAQEGARSSEDVAVA
jgi:hypothetical protein